MEEREPVRFVCLASFLVVPDCTARSNFEGSVLRIHEKRPNCAVYRSQLDEICLLVQSKDAASIGTSLSSRDGGSDT